MLYKIAFFKCFCPKMIYNELWSKNWTVAQKQKKNNNFKNQKFLKT